MVKNASFQSQVIWVEILASALSSCVTLGRNGNPLQDSCLENPMDRGVWWATDHGVAKSQRRLKHFSTALDHVVPGGKFLPFCTLVHFRSEI